MSAVRLMRWDDDTWVESAVEKIDSPDIEDRLARLIEPVDAGVPVMIFLPRDQILYTQLVLDADADSKAQVEAAMEGRTPYSLDELSIDWDRGSDDTILVAAIARDTLDEAADFAEVRDLTIAGYSTLFSGSDFPRLPQFDGPAIVATETVAEPPPQFSTARVPSRPPTASVAAASAAASAKARFTPKPTAAIETPERAVNQPVIEVADDTPVVQVKAPQVPLDPGLPISAPNAPPRIRSDIGAASVSGHAASLTPPSGSIRVRKNSAPISTFAVFAIAFLLTVGIAFVVWNTLPMRPNSTVEAPVDTGSVSENVVEQTSPTLEEETVVDLAPSPEDPPAEEEVTFAILNSSEVASELGLNLPTPNFSETLTFNTVSLGTAININREAQLITVAPTLEALPKVDLNTPVFKLPTFEADVQLAAPVLGREPDLGENSESIFVSAFELPDLASDAIALPNVSSLSPNTLPNLGAEAVADLPAPGPDGPDPVASAVEEALTDALIGPGGLVQTDHARALTDIAPQARPAQFTDDIERRQFGGRTRAQLAGLRPPPRPESAQSIAILDDSEPSALAVTTSFSPASRPGNIAALVSAARVQQEAARVTASAAVRTPDTSSAVEAALEDDAEPTNRAVRPRSLSIPTTASVARQATIENAIRLNRINLVGVYGAPTDRRALVRLSSGRYIKVKVGDSVDGGTVAQITDSELYYRKGTRTLSLQIPQG